MSAKIRKLIFHLLSVPDLPYLIVIPLCDVIMIIRKKPTFSLYWLNGCLSSKRARGSRGNI